MSKVFGSSEGKAELMINSVNTLSSGWIEITKRSGRFSKYSWNKTEVVEMTTIDKLMGTYGAPVFIKIGVEGFEHEVISGLSRPNNYISLEWVTEFTYKTFRCIEYLGSLGECVFNYFLGESMKLELNEYVTAKKIKNILNSYKSDNKIFGGVYCQFAQNQ